MLHNFKHALVICLLAFASMQTAQATMIYSSAGTVPGTSASTATLSIFDTFEVEAGMEYLATLTDIGTVLLPVIDNFDSLSLVIFDDSFATVGTPLLLASGETSVSFSFTAISNASYSIALGGATDTLSTYVATVAAVPVPAAIWFMGSAMFALVGFGRRKIA